MAKMIRRVRSGKGFTLTELIIVSAIMVVLIAAVAAFSYPVQNMVRATGATADAINANETIAEYIRGRLAYADALYIHYGVNPTNTPDFSASMSRLTGTGGKVTTSNPTHGKAGALIIHYEEDSANPERSSFKLYDYPITASTTSYAAACLNAAGTGLNESGAVFDDAFYGDIQRIIYLPKANPFTNSTNGEVFMNFEIHSFKGDADYIAYQADGTTVDKTNSRYIYPLILKDIYEKVDNKIYTIKSSGTGTVIPTRADWQQSFRDVVDSDLGLSLIRKGDANTSSFVLENFKSADIYQPSSFSMNYPEVTTYAPLSTMSGNDIVIFYHIPHFS
ncbi:MAG: prepilin-type N-terminal cleavage/methylation domain-containing protein [Bacteroides sp.]|nr:prepilin-type N-terminal cleavage/methylation domain-containing protein [Roseburia sp.]MCM1462927.1 prepilin-type N-terminal cleavage/methylation domain-containing protein [Bacteroides sp.]